MNNSVLACHDLAKTYLDGLTKIEVLKQIDLQVNPAEMIAIVGASGSGKSTFLHLLGGLDHPTRGKVIVNGKNIHELTESEKCRVRNQCLGFVYQFHHLLPEFSALENVSMPLLIRGEQLTKVIIEKATYLLTQVGLDHRLHHRLGQLSGGERQRVAIARALIAEPLCVLADEPTGNLDPNNAEKVLQLFFDLQKAQKTSVVMVTHDPDIAKRAQRVFRIEEGKLIEGI
ncbi:MAG: lipoprotein releasing system, ATP-binding protein [Gammaproteobacteria bacterium RIFCSPHIGHO2_12_FULL_37_14]|nr:MAG: lipoprotein releasing system, ATP-binding protein [Gammaproteobacteria bacterium RIFCSPHIGHO2_12_FULL_37_14]